MSDRKYRAPAIRKVSEEVLADDYYVLRKATFELQRADRIWVTHRREAYDRGNGAAILLHDPARETVLLIRQFRWPAYSNGHPDGMLLEVPAGLLDDDDAETAIRREVTEETGLAIGEVKPLFESYMSPGSVTERLHFYYATYGAEDGVAERAGVAEEGEEVEPVELPVGEALDLVRRGEILDAKTIMLLRWLETSPLGSA
jgi:nudix-type nucleoside diphosphatase (YffH/AdpP family)